MGFTRQARASDNFTDRTYFVGNSLTDEFNINRRDDFPNPGTTWFSRMVNLRHIGQYNNWDMQSGPGGQLNGYYGINGPTDDYGNARTRKIRTAFADPDPLTQPRIIMLQPFDQMLDYPASFNDTNGDVPTIQRYLDLLESAGNTQAQVYIYASWPRRTRSDGSPTLDPAPFDYRTQWAKRYDHYDNEPGFNIYKRLADAHNTIETRDYFQRLTNAVNANNPALEKPLRIIPVGDVFFELENRMKDGHNEFEPFGLIDFNSLYVDGIHRSNIGNYIVAMTVYSAIFGISPKPTEAYADGLSGLAYGLQVQFPDRDERLQLEALLQDVVWDVVHVSDATSSPIPEPTTLLAGGLFAAVVLRRSRLISPSSKSLTTGV